MVRKELTLPTPCICLVAGRSAAPAGELVARVRDAVEAGVDMVQLREKELPGGELLALAERLKAAIDGKALFVVNERVDVALACGADGVHLGERALPPRAARRISGGALLIGRSVHSLESAMAADAEGADYLIAGTMFETNSKPGKTPEGPDLLRRIAGVTYKPVLGIGGVTPSNAPKLIEAGAAGVAVMSGVLAAADPAKAVEALRAALRRPAASGAGRR